MSCIPGCLYVAAYCSIFYYSKYTVFSILIYLAQSESFFKNRILSIMYIVYLNLLLTAMLLIGLRLSSATGLAMLLDYMHHRGCPLRKSPSGGSLSLKQLRFQGLILEEMEEISEFVNFIPSGEVFNGNEYLFHLSRTNLCPNHVQTPIGRIRNGSAKKPKGSRRTSHGSSEQLSVIDP